MRTPRRPPVKPHHEPRETPFVTLLLAETTPQAAKATAAPADPDDDDLPPFARPGYFEKPSTDTPVRLYTRKS